MHNKTSKIIRAVVNTLATAFFFTCLLVVIFYLTCGKRVDAYIAIINKLGVSYNQTTETKPVSFDSVAKKIKKSPRYGNVYAKLKIPKIDLSLDVYHGDSLKILKNGVGHYTLSYFPGETGTVLLSAHNTPEFFARLPELAVGDQITIEASYGTFEYKVTSTAVLHENALAETDLSQGEEKLILYTCYPIPNYGYTYQRYVVYADKVGDTYD